MIKFACLTLPLLLISAVCLGQAKEMSNSEMTEAYIEDGAIVVKQQEIKPAPSKQKIPLKLGAGEPAVSGKQRLTQQERQNEQQYRQIGDALLDGAHEQQLNQYNLNQNSASIVLPNFQSAAELSRMQHANNLVRNGLRLSSNTTITPDLMTLYLSTFSGQSNGDLLGAHQSATADGLQFIIPNANGLKTGTFTTGDNSMNIDISNQQLIFNLLYPKK